jgi:polyhydroxybutyrate depolymerase
MNKTTKITFPVLLFTVVVVLSILSCRNEVAAQNNPPGDYTGSIIFGGVERTYLIHIPLSYDETTPTPLLIALHGGKGSGELMEKLTLRGFNDLSDTENFIVVYPDGVEGYWNDGRDLKSYRPIIENVDDVGFISALMDHLSIELNIDKNRIYVTGISNGALMSYRLACELSEKIAAIAPVAAPMSEFLYLNCSPTRQMPLLIIMGTFDPLVPWRGGEIHVFGLSYGRVLSIPETVSYWLTHNQCLLSPIITWEPNRDPQDGTRVLQAAYTQCEEGTEVVLYAVVGGGHTWPGGWQNLPEWVIGRTSKDIDANEVIWSDLFHSIHRISILLLTAIVHHLALRRLNAQPTSKTNGHRLSLLTLGHFFSITSSLPKTSL